MAAAPPWLRGFEDLEKELTQLKEEGRKTVSLGRLHLTGAELVELIHWLTTPPYAAAPIVLADISMHRSDADPPNRSEVDLSYAMLDRALTLQFQQLPDVMIFRKCQLPDLAIIGPAQRPPAVSACDLNLRAADIRGSVVLKGLHLSRPIEAQAIRIKDDFRALDCKVGGSRKQFDYEVHEDRSSGAQEPASLLLDRADIGGRLLLQRCEFHGPAGLFNTRIRGGVELQNAVFRHLAGAAILADGLRVGGDFTVREGVQVHGQLCMVNARIGGELDLRGAIFHIEPGMVAAEAHPLSGGEALTCYRLQVGGSVRLGRRPPAPRGMAGQQVQAVDAPIAEGQVTTIGCLNFHGATIAGHFRVEGLRMERNGGWQDEADQAAIVLNAAVIGRNLEFINVFANRQITLVAAEIKGDLIFSRVRLSCRRVAIFGIRSVIRGHLRLGADRSDQLMNAFLSDDATLTDKERSEIFGIVDFSGSTIGGFVDATALTIHGGEVRALDPAHRFGSGRNVLALVMDEAVIGRRLCLGHDESGGAAAILLEQELVETHFYGTVSLVGVRVRGDVYLNGAEFKAGCRPPPRSYDDEPPGWRRLTELRRVPARCLQYVIKRPIGPVTSNRPDEGSFGPIAVDLTRARIEGCLNWTIPRIAR